MYDIQVVPRICLEYFRSTALNLLQGVVVLLCFVEFNGASAKAAVVLACCRPFAFFFFFRLLSCFPPHRPYSASLCLISPHAGILFLFLLRVVLSVKHQSVCSSCCFVRETTAAIIFSVFFCQCNSYLFLFSTYSVHGVPLAIAAFPFLSDLASHSSENLSFVWL